MARGLAIRRYEVSELQRLNLRKRGRWLVGLELIEGVSNRSLECKPFLVPKLWFAGSSVVFAVDSSRRMMGLRRRNLPRCQTHAAGLGLVGATGSAEWFVHVPAGTPQHASGQAHRTLRVRR
jgi:hypothetical protein